MPLANTFANFWGVIWPSLCDWETVQALGPQAREDLEKKISPTHPCLAMLWSKFVVYKVDLQPCLRQYTLQSSPLAHSPHHTSWRELQDTRVERWLLWGRLVVLRFKAVGIGSAIALSYFLKQLFLFLWRKQKINVSCGLSWELFNMFISWPF